MACSAFKKKKVPTVHNLGKANWSAVFKKLCPLLLIYSLNIITIATLGKCTPEQGGPFLLIAGQAGNNIWHSWTCPKVHHPHPGNWKKKNQTKTNPPPKKKNLSLGTKFSWTAVPESGGRSPRRGKPGGTPAAQGQERASLNSFKKKKKKSKWFGWLKFSYP